MAVRLQKVVKLELSILGPGRFRPGPPRILKTLDVAHRISSVSRGLAPFSLGLPMPSSTRTVL